MSKLDGSRLGDCDEEDAEPVDANASVSGCVDVGIKEGDIQSGGPPPYNRAIQTLQ